MPNCEVAYPPVELKNVLGEYLSAHGKTQLRIAETEKYAHVTFFFNGGVEVPTRARSLRHPQPQGCHLRPEARDERPRSRCRVRQAHRERQVRCGHPELRKLRYGRPHRRVRGCCQAVEAVDTCVDQVVTAVLNAGGCAFITADHATPKR